MKTPRSSFERGRITGLPGVRFMNHEPIVMWEGD